MCRGMILAHSQEDKILHKKIHSLMNIFTDEAVFLLLSPVSLDLSSTLNHQELFSTNGNLESFIKILPCFTMFHFYFRCTLSLASVGVYKQIDFTETNYESSQQGVGV